MSCEKYHDLHLTKQAKSCLILIECLVHLLSITDFSNEKIFYFLFLLSLSRIRSSDWKKIFLVWHTCDPLKLMLYFINYLESLHNSFWKSVRDFKIYSAFEHKNKSSAKVPTHRVIDLYSKDTCFDSVVTHKSLDLFWKVLNTKAIKGCHTITIEIQCYPVGSYWFALNKFST